MKVTFLGTAAGQPSLKRNVTSIAIEMDDSKIILVDCGEATLHQFMRSKLKISNIHTILITHLHGDHIYGLPGLCCTLNDARTQPLNIYGPRGLKKYCEIFQKSIHNFEFNVHEIVGEYKKICRISTNTHNYSIDACFIKHTAECYAYSIQKMRIKPKIIMELLQPIFTQYENQIKQLGFKNPNIIIKHLISDGVFDIPLNNSDETQSESKFKTLRLDDFTLSNKEFKIVVALDNNSCENIFKYFNNSDVLIHESTFAILPEMCAEERSRITSIATSRGHSTNIMAAQNAFKLGCSNIILTHFSNRYEINEEGKMVDEAKITATCYETGFAGSVFPAYDFSEFSF